MYFPRTIEKEIKKNLFKRKIIIIYGARQVGKTTLVQKIVSDFTKVPTLFLNCDEADYQETLSRAGTSVKLKEIIGNYKLIVIDEAQRVSNIGLKLKLLVDNFPQIQVIATGSSSFELSDEISEPLTGRSRVFKLYPLSFTELAYKNALEANRALETLLVFGTYPEVQTVLSVEEKKETIKNIAANYLYKDILKFQNLKSAELVQKLLQALALQVGNEVSFNELGSLLGVNKATVAAWIEILQKAFVIFRVSPFSRNLRKELGKLRKIYFYDLGVRNALIRNFNPLAIRDDAGRLWENFVIAERFKTASNLRQESNFYFWRTYDQQEIDLVEEEEGRLFGYEIKLGKIAKKAPKAWREGYPQASWQAINRDNYFGFLTKRG